MAGRLEKNEIVQGFDFLKLLSLALPTKQFLTDNETVSTA
jgi:hypothetical protein